MKRGPVPIRHWTVETVSDHRAYLVQYRLPGGELFTVGTWNMSVAAAKQRPVRLAADLVRVARLCDVLALQEAGAARELITTAAAAYLPERDVYFGNGKTGQASTPLIARRRPGSSLHFHTHLLIGRRPLNPAAAGPSHSKPKWLMCATLSVPHRGIGAPHATEGGRDELNVCGLHSTPSLRFPLNRLAATFLLRRAARIASQLDGWTVVVGDYNAVAGATVLAPFRRRRFRSTQRRLGPLPTGPHRTPIDDQYFEVRSK